MDSIGISKLIISSVASIIDANKINLIIDDIYNLIACVYDDVKNSAIDTAKSSIRSAYSNHLIKSMQLLNAINSLSFAYNILKSALNKRIVHYSFLGLIKEEEDLIPFCQRKQYMEEIWNLSDLILVLYSEVGDRENVINWTELSKNNYYNYLDEFYMITPSDLQKEHPELVYVVRKESTEIEETNHITGDYMTTTTYYDDLEFTKEGIEFIKQKKKELAAKHIQEILTLKIV